MRFDENDARRNIRLVYVFDGSRMALFVVPVISIWFREQLGLSFHEFLLTEAVFAGTLAIFEVPSGWLADRWGRVASLRLSSAFWLIGIVTLWTAEDFLQATIAQAIMGIAQSLGSGTDSALLYESLGRLGRQRDYVRYESRKHGMGMLILATVSVSSGYIYAYQADLIFALEIVMFSICGVSAVLMTEPVGEATGRAGTTATGIIGAAISCLRADRQLGLLIASGTVLFGSTITCVWLNQGIYARLALPVTWYGLLMVISTAGAGLVSLWTPRVVALLGPGRQFVLYWFLIWSGLLMIGLFPSVWMLPAIFLPAAAWAMGAPALAEQINQRIASTHRAIVLSFSALCQRLLFIPMAHVAGLIVDQGGAPTAALSLSSFVMVFGATPVGLLIWWQSDHRIKRQQTV